MDVAVAYFKTIFQYIQKGSKENNKNPPSEYLNSKH
jgi:hypothetical protein